DLQILEHRLDDHVRVTDPVAGDIGNQPVARIADPPRILQPVLEQLRRAAHRRRELFGRLVLQRDAQSAHRAPGGDVATHRAGGLVVNVIRAALIITRSGTTSSTSPSFFARFGSIVRPVSIMSSAAGAPIARGSRRMPPHAGTMPSITSGSAKRVPGSSTALR